MLKRPYIEVFTNNLLYSNQPGFHQEKVSLKIKNWLEINAILF